MGVLGGGVGGARRRQARVGMGVPRASLHRCWEPARCRGFGASRSRQNLASLALWRRSKAARPGRALAASLCDWRQTTSRRMPPPVPQDWVYADEDGVVVSHVGELML